MKTKGFIAVLLLVTVFVVFVAVGTSQAAEEKGPIKIGFIGRLAAPFGLTDKTALELSVADLNAEGGIMGRPVKLIVMDSKGQIPLVVAAYKTLVMTEKCTLVVVEGSEPTFSCMEVGAELYKKYPHLMFSIFVAHDTPTIMVCNNYDKYKFFFRPFEKGGIHYDPKVHWDRLWTKVMKIKKIAFMAEDMAFAEPFVKGIPGHAPSMPEYFKSIGLEVVYTGQNSIQEKMFMPIFEEIAKSGAEAIYWITAYSDTVTMAKQWAQSAAKDIEMVTMAGAPCYAAFWKMTGGAALGWMTLDPEVYMPFTDKTLHFTGKMKAKGVGMMNSMYPAYDSPWMLKAAIEKAKTASNIDLLIKTLEQIEVQRISWIWKFDKCHDPVTGYPPYHPSVWGQFQDDGKVVALIPPEVVSKVNPKDHFIPVRELRARAKGAK
jgi:ABC-type branched-subunit amino acid transport system substrate-binding protein